MRSQLSHLLSCAQLPNVSLRVIPFRAGAPSISSTPFTILDFPGAEIRSAVAQERVGGDTITDGPSEVRSYRRKFATLTEHALDRAESIRLIQDAEKELK